MWEPPVLKALSVSTTSYRKGFTFILIELQHASVACNTVTTAESSKFEGRKGHFAALFHLYLHSDTSPSTDVFSGSKCCPTAGEQSVFALPP
jgi:hypothetical protein